MQDDPPQDEPEESQSDSSDVDDGDALDISGIEIEVGNTDGGDSNVAEEPAQSLILGDSLTGDIEYIKANDILFDDGIFIIAKTNVSGCYGGLDTSGGTEDEKPWRSADMGGAHWEFPWPDEYEEFPFQMKRIT